MGTRIKCAKCGDIIEGDKQGTLISCKCNAIYIDETPYYFRLGGNPEDIIMIKSNGEERTLAQMHEDDLKYKRIDKMNYYLNIAETTAQRSTCLKRNYGAILVNNDEIISTGFNGAPRCLPSCLDTKSCLREDKDRGTDYSFCKSVHAEQNAIISASRNNMIGSDLYLVGKEKDSGEYVVNPSPCALCKRMIINAGINRVIIRNTTEDFSILEVKDWNIDDITGGY